MSVPDHYVLDSTFATRYVTEPIPKYKMPENGLPQNVVSQLIRDLRTLDARPNLNLASFVTTWMEPEARTLMMESLDVNQVDTEEYPSSTMISNRCVSMLATLLHSPAVDEHGVGDAVGAATVGSSEAIMLGALALKKRWQERRKAAGLDTSSPNLVMSSATHVCWEKFCRYWDVEARYVMAEEGRWCATPELLAACCDENTIGVCCILGSTYTGEFEDVKGTDALIEELNSRNGWEIKIHVDGASGGMIAPFLYPDLEWDFRLKNVVSVNISGHKYGLVHPGIGWVIWRDSKHLPESMIFYCDYLGSLERSITLNFSRGASQIIGQYYQFLRLGTEGYTKIFLNLKAIAGYVRSELLASKHFEVLSPEIGVPVVAFKLSKLEHSDGHTAHRVYDEFQVAERVRLAGWVIPAYRMPKGAEDIKLMRITIREDFSLTMAEAVIEELHRAVEWLDTHYTLPLKDATEFAEAVLGRQLSRLDTSVMTEIRDFEQHKIIKPC